MCRDNSLEATDLLETLDQIDCEIGGADQIVAGAFDSDQIGARRDQVEGCAQFLNRSERIVRSVDE